jgi:hypothetical protein
MNETVSNNGGESTAPAIRDALRFWERGRILYNAILTVIVLLWVARTWPHFRPSLTLGSLEAMVVLGLAANLCYSTAYVVEIFMQPVVARIHWRRFRRALWLLGMLFAILLENYWIADEIYPAADQPPPAFIGGAAVPTATFASNMNFPAPLAVLGFLSACGGLFLGLAAGLIFWFARKPKFARVTGLAIAGLAIVYLGLLVGFSTGSRATTLARGQEKYFCEIDCHLAYSIVDVNAQPDGRFVVTLRTRFDETTTSPSRPKDAALTPSPREVHLIDSAGREYAPISTQGTPLLTPLKPADSYTTQLEFQIPKDATGSRLLLSTAPAWPDHLVIGDENSWLHKKTYFAL